MPSRTHRGFTLVELLVSAAILAIIGAVLTHIVFQLAWSEALVAREAEVPSAAWPALHRIVLDAREMTAPTRGGLLGLDADRLRFLTRDGQEVSFHLSDGDLFRDAHLLCEGVRTLQVEYWKADGTQAALPADVYWVTVRMEVVRGEAALWISSQIFPRELASLRYGWRQE